MIKEITVTKETMSNILMDEEVYCIKRDFFDKSKYRMEPIGECSINELFSNEVKFIKITKD